MGCKGHLTSWNGSVTDRDKAEMCAEQHPGLYSLLWLKQFSMSAVESSFTSCEVLPEFLWNTVRHRSQRHWELRCHGCYFAWALYLPYSLYSSTHLLYANNYFVYILFVQGNFRRKNPKLILKLSLLILLDQKNVSSLDGWQYILLVKGVICDFMFSFLFGVLQAVCAYIRSVKLQRLKSQTQRDILYKS